MASLSKRINKKTLFISIAFLLITTLLLMFVLRTKELKVNKYLSQSYQEVDIAPIRQPAPLFNLDYDEVIFVPPYVSSNDFRDLSGYYMNLFMPTRISLHAMNEGYVIALFVKKKWIFGFAKVSNRPIDFGALWDTNNRTDFVAFSKKEFESLYYKKVAGRGAIPILAVRHE